jgi:hypothetical protein
MSTNNFFKTVIIRLKLQYGLCKYRNWGMQGEKALHLRIPDGLSDSERKLSGECVDDFDLTWISCVLVRSLVISYLKYLIIFVITHNITVMIRNCNLSNLNQKDCQGFSQTFFYFVSTLDNSLRFQVGERAYIFSNYLL